MRERVGKLSGGALEGMPWLGTFHAIAAKMLRVHAELVGLHSNFTILDVDDQLRVLKQLITAANLDEKRWPARQLAGLIDRWKNRGWTPDQVDAGESEIYAAGRGAEFYAAYQERLKTLNACDFGDLLLHMLRIFRTQPDLLQSYRDRFRYILVDEYQDTNASQYEWLKCSPRRATTFAASATTTIDHSWRARRARLLGFDGIPGGGSSGRANSGRDQSAVRRSRLSRARRLDPWEAKPGGWTAETGSEPPEGEPSLSGTNG